ncbi:hypothetical protein BH10PLA2_BH10PLA2_20570 [soil metagenome]
MSTLRRGCFMRRSILSIFEEVNLQCLAAGMRPLPKCREPAFRANAATRTFSQRAALVVPRHFPGCPGAECLPSCKLNSIGHKPDSSVAE